MFFPCPCGLFQGALLPANIQRNSLWKAIWSVWVTSMKFNGCSYLFMSTLYHAMSAGKGSSTPATLWKMKKLQKWIKSIWTSEMWKNSGVHIKLGTWRYINVQATCPVSVSDSVNEGSLFMWVPLRWTDWTVKTSCSHSIQ